ncbi:glycosyltransferase family 4 protein [Acaryochloris sp. IP29b_bin.148]|uniref:glycosyltransferase family 4 protein n=1 Tax=Acaryochloris sp. IP29b_bin.148 TaxID=2969218 RepID=UPI00260FCE11|nr:glycosyltransferase family 4 protein [Acaryochloris sp. IP29b_bin.148]
MLKRAAFYWQPVVREFSKLVPQTKLFTGSWPGYAYGCEKSFKYEIVGQRKLIKLKPNASGYGTTLMYLSPKILISLLKYQPHVIFADGFSLWTLLVLVFKPVFRWQVIVFCDGSSPSTDHINSPLRLQIRRLMGKVVDVFIANNSAASKYLAAKLMAEDTKIYSCPFLVSDGRALQQISGQGNSHLDKLHQIAQTRPIFLYVGQIIPRKGIKELLDACLILKNKKNCNFTLLIVGDGQQRKTLEDYTTRCSLERYVKWIGEIEYSSLGVYFEYVDAFVFPSLEDVWGMVVSEAMAFGKPTLCSDKAGANELIIEGKNGLCFNPHHPSELADAMFKLISDPGRISEMGKQAKNMSKQYNPSQTAKMLAQLISSQ